MDILEIKHKADRELETMQGMLPAIDDLPTEKEELIDKLIDLSKELHSTANRLAGWAGYLSRR